MFPYVTAAVDFPWFSQVAVQPKLTLLKVHFPPEEVGRDQQKYSRVAQALIADALGVPTVKNAPFLARILSLYVYISVVDLFSELPL